MSDTLPPPTSDLDLLFSHSDLSENLPVDMPLVNGPEVMRQDGEWIYGTYARQPIVFVRGEGTRLWDSEGQEYLDFLAGIAVVQVGHCHPQVASAIAGQAGTLMHVSNLYHNALAAPLAARLCRLTGMERAFFCNSGAEANEAAIKIARKWGKMKRGADCHEIITFAGSFHGRTMGALSATANAKYQQPFTPLVPGFVHAPLSDLPALDELITERTCAVMIEPIQGESGVHVVAPEFLHGVRALCDEAEALLICDEVQCGLGRTGHFLASQRAGVRADVVTLAKGIADGFPMGACLAQGEAAHTLVPGDHGSTFAGQPLACAASMATLDVIENEGLMAHADTTGTYLRERLRDLQAEFPGRIAEVRGAGLMNAVQWTHPEAKAIFQRLLTEKHIITNATGEHTTRLVPPLVVSRADCDLLVDALRDVMRTPGE